MAWLTGWQSRKKITLTEQGGGSYNAFPTLIDVAFITDKMQSDFDDIRFTEDDGETLIAYGLRTKTDGVTAKFVVVRNYTAATSQDIYMYYGNPDAAAGNVAFASWVDTWYTANHWGGGIGAHSNSTCSLYPRTRSGTIPAWAGDVFFIGGVPDAYASTGSVYYGRTYNNSNVAANRIAWASQAVCNGLYTQSICPYGRRQRNTPSLNHAAWIKGASNTVYFGHYAGSNPSIAVAWLAVSPDIAFGAEEVAMTWRYAYGYASPVGYASRAAAQTARSIIGFVSGAGYAERTPAIGQRIATGFVDVVGWAEWIRRKVIPIKVSFSERTIEVSVLSKTIRVSLPERIIKVR